MENWKRRANAPSRNANQALPCRIKTGLELLKHPDTEDARSCSVDNSEIGIYRHSLTTLSNVYQNTVQRTVRVARFRDGLSLEPF